nr:MAG: hypothetical protein [Microvirus sp.]
MFKTAYNTKDFPSPLCANNGKIITETAGYISAQKRIENLMLAGQRLIASRNAMYDFQGEIDPNAECDPTRRGEFDLADASQELLRISNKEPKAADVNANIEPEAADVKEENDIPV